MRWRGRHWPRSTNRSSPYYMITIIIHGYFSWWLLDYEYHQYQPTGSRWVQWGCSRALCLLWKVVVTSIMMVAMMMMSYVLWGRWWELSWWHCCDFRHLYLTKMKAFDICCHFCGFSCICVTVVSNDSYVCGLGQRKFCMSMNEEDHQLADSVAMAKD